jgi:hypothetical protein
VGNGGCDWHVPCINILGNRTCGKCPFGYVGDGWKCSALCGDKNCNASLNETCVSCPMDCPVSPCGVCGDGFCDTTETCASCFEDCSRSCDTKCDFCSEHGSCVLGVCVCDALWTGPSCNDRAINFLVALAETEPSLIIQSTPASSSSFVSFSVGLRALQEITSEGIVVVNINTSNINFSISHDLPNDTNYQMWILSSTLQNQAIIDITFIQFLHTSNYSFYNETKTYAPNTMKMNVKITNWPFKAISNFLEVFVDSKAEEQDECKRDGKSHSSGPTVVWAKNSVNGVSIYTQFDSDSYVDGRKRSISFSPKDDLYAGSVAAKIPHFWTYAEMDPTYTILFDLDNPQSFECDMRIQRKNPIGSEVVIAVVVPIVAIAVVAVIVYTIYRHKRTQKTRKQFSAVRLSSLSSK